MVSEINRMSHQHSRVRPRLQVIMQQPPFRERYHAVDRAVQPTRLVLRLLLQALPHIRPIVSFVLFETILILLSRPLEAIPASQAENVSETHNRPIFQYKIIIL